MTEANKLLDEANTFLYMGKIREAGKIWDQETLTVEDRIYQETFGIRFMKTAISKA